MDIHKPKPWHGVREFLKEYVIIVVGVLTALGADAVVQQLHWRHEAEAAREVIRRDSLRLLGWVGEIDGSGACVDARLSELRDILDKAEEAGRLPPLGNTLKAPTMGWFMRGWDSALSSGVLPHLRPGEGARFGAMQNTVLALTRFRDDSTAQWAQLSVMAGPGRRLSESEAASLRSAIQKARVDAIAQRTSADNLALMVLDTGLVSTPDAQGVWRAGVRRAQAQEPTCHPIGPAPGTPGIPGLAAPPKPPQGSYDQAISAFRDTVVR
jgi:hypothetical protein